MNSLIYVDAYYMSNLKKEKKKKRRKKRFFLHCKCPCLWSALCTTSQLVTDFAWTKNLVENLRLTPKKGPLIFHGITLFQWYLICWDLWEKWKKKLSVYSQRILLTRTWSFCHHSPSHINRSCPHHLPHHRMLLKPLNYHQTCLNWRFVAVDQRIVTVSRHIFEWFRALHFW